MADPSIDLGELLDLRMAPAWVHEPAQENRYAHVEGVEESEREHGPFPGGRNRGDKNRQRHGDRRQRLGHGETTQARSGARRGGWQQGRHRQGKHREGVHPSSREIPLEIAVRFLPHPPAFENVVAQIRLNSVAYSLFALARLFLAKPERYDVRLVASEKSPLFRLGENGAVAADKELLERNAFQALQPDFYKVEVTEAEPIKGNFKNVARCKLSGKVLGPTNHHDYQKKLRNLYEQRFSRKMSFSDYQRQIEIVADPAFVEKWKEDARKVVTFSTLQEESHATFPSAAEAEKHFRQRHLPGLVRATPEAIIDGKKSRQLPDRVLNRLIENGWAQETRSPSHMMQELATQFRQTGLHVFRHRRGMLFVSPIRVRPLAPGAAVSPLIQRIIETIAAAPGTNRKELADTLMAGLTKEETERAKLALAADLRWLISEGYVIEFNDGAMDLPKMKTPDVRHQAPEKFQSVTSKPKDAASETDSVAPPTDVPVLAATSLPKLENS